MGTDPDDTDLTADDIAALTTRGIPVDTGSVVITCTCGQQWTPADWWTTTDIARHLGVSVQTISSYRARGEMPEPAFTIGRTHVWLADRITTWHAGRPKTVRQARVKRAAIRDAEVFERMNRGAEGESFHDFY
jgi:hypothetical protein